MNAPLNLVLVADRIVRALGQEYFVGDENTEKIPSVRALHAWWQALALTNNDSDYTERWHVGWEETEYGFSCVFAEKLVMVDVDYDRVEVTFLKDVASLAEHKVHLDFQVRITANSGIAFFGWPVTEATNPAHIELLWKLDAEVFDGRIRATLEDALAHQGVPAYVNVGTAIRLLEPKQLVV